MKKMQNSQTVNNQINPGNINNNGSNTLLSILLHRLELMGLFKSFMVQTSLGRCSSMVRSHFVFSTFSILGLVFVLSSCFSLATARNTSAASTLTVSIADTISLDILPTSSTGTFAHSSTSTNTVSVSTNNYTGYTLGIAASNANDNALSFKVNDAVVDTIASHTNTSGVSESNYANDTYASTNNLNNTWGYRPSTYYDTANNTNVDNTSTNLYFPAPTSASVNTLAKTTTANPSTANNYNIAIGARVGLDKTPGAYTNTFVITVVANPTTYSLTYNANAGGDSTVANMPSNVASGTSYADTIMLSSTVPTRTGYTFAGWCATNTSQTSCSGTLYNSTNNNLDSFPIDRTASSNSLNAYAIWTINTYSVTVNFAGAGVGSVTFENATYGNADTVSTTGGTTSLKHGVEYTITMVPTSSSYELDNWATTANGSLGSSTANPTTYTITDTATLTATGKSSKTYMQDLTLANCSADGMTVYDKRDEKDYTVKLINGQCWMTQNLRYLGDTGSTAITMTIGNNNSHVANRSIALWSLNSAYSTYANHCDSTYGYNYACVYDSGNTTGVWYNYCAASAGTICGSSNSTAATSDICPAGWHLPSGPNTTSGTDINKLVGNTTSGYQAATSGLTAFSAVADGYYSGGSRAITGGGHWWSATASGTTFRYNLAYNSRNGQFSGNAIFNRYYGLVVRCVRSS